MVIMLMKREGGRDGRGWLVGCLIDSECEMV